MEAPLSECTTVEQRAVIRFLWAEGVRPAEIHRRMLVQYGKKCMGQRKVYEWVERFKSGRTSVTDEARLGRPSTSRTHDHVNLVNALIREDRRITVSTIAGMLDISYGSACTIVNDDLGYRKVCARWVPKCLTDQIKQQRVEIATRFLQSYEEDGTLLERIVTGDEVWVHHIDPESKKQNIEWKHTASPAKKKLRSIFSSRTILLTVFWDMHGPVLEHYQEQARTDSSGTYLSVLEEELKDAICNKRKELLSKTILLYQDNVYLNMMATKMGSDGTMKFEGFPHPPHSPDLAPTDYHLFNPLKEAIRSKWFATDEEMKQAMHTWLQEQPQAFYYNGIKKLVDRCKRCVEQKGEYIEK